MLYNVYEAQRALIEPFAEMAEAVSRMYGNPYTAFGQIPGAKGLAASFALFNRLGKSYEKPPFDIPYIEIDGTRVAINEIVEIDKPFCELRRFKRFSDQPTTLQKTKEQPVVLVVAPLSGHNATLLRDTVRTLLHSHKVYITDWKNARTVPLPVGSFSLDGYVLYVQEFIRHLQARYGNCHVISVCQPTVPVMAAISLMASRGEKTPLSMTMMGGPIDAQRSPTSVDDLAARNSLQWFENNVIHQVPHQFPGAGRRVYPGFLQHLGFVAMNPRRHAQSHWNFFEGLIRGDDDGAEQHRAFYDEYNAVLDIDAAFYLDTIRTVFQDFSLVNGSWDVQVTRSRFERVRPQDIKRTALFTIEGEMDDISGFGQTRAAHELCTGIRDDARQHYEVPGAGHFGIFSGRRWRKMVYPRIQAFIAQHSRETTAPATRTSPAAKPAKRKRRTARAA